MHRFSSVFVAALCVICGCNAQFSTSYETTTNGKKTCAMNVRNKPVASILDDLEGRMAVTIKVKNVDESKSVTTKLKASSWEETLQQFCDQQGWDIAYDEEVRTYTISAPKPK